MSKKQGRVLKPASFENPLHRSDQGKGVKPIHPSTTDPRYTPPSFEAAGKGEDTDLLRTEEDEALRDQSYAIGALPDDIESRELGQMHGDVRFVLSSTPHNFHLLGVPLLEPDLLR
jgi:hypothetical protein